MLQTTNQSSFPIPASQHPSHHREAHCKIAPERPAVCTSSILETPLWDVVTVDPEILHVIVSWRVKKTTKPGKKLNNQEIDISWNVKMMRNQENGGKYYTKSWEKIMNQKNGGKYYTKSWEKIMNQKNGGKYYTKSWEKIMNQKNGGTYYTTSWKNGEPEKWWKILYKIMGKNNEPEKWWNILYNIMEKWWTRKMVENIIQNHGKK